MLFDHENGNYKNSEIAMLYLEKIAAETPDISVKEREAVISKTLAEASLVEEQSKAQHIANEKTLMENEDLLDFLERREAANHIINHLNKVAADLGNQDALQVEMAIEEIKEILGV